MVILSGDVKLLKSANMADVTEGGGAPTGNVIADGVSNAIFPDISELDRAGGRVSLRKTFAGVHSDDTDIYFGANVIVAEPPKDPRVSVTLFSNGEAFDTRAEAQSRVEAYLNTGPEMPGYLYENHIQGQRVFQIFQRTTDALPVVGQTVVLVENEGLSTEKKQYVRATAVTSTTRTFTYNSGSSVTNYQAAIVTVEISDALRFDLTGSPASPMYARTIDGLFNTGGNAKYQTKIRDTVVADAGTYVGVVPLAEAANLGDLTVNAETIYTQLVPSAQTETPLADLSPLQLTKGYVATGGAFTMTLTQVFTANSSMNIGGGILPGSLTIVRSGVTVTDAAGSLYASGSQVGTVDYENGNLTLGSNVFGTSGGSHTITYTPASVPSVFGPSYGFDITAPNRSLSYVFTLASIPAAGSLAVNFQVNKRWYVLRDNGQGALKGSTSGDGAGTVNYTTGTVTVTLGALPDVGSTLIYNWTPALLMAKCESATLVNGGKAFANFDLYDSVVPGSVSITWATDKSATDNGAGSITGDASGTVDYNNGHILLSPNAIPAPNTDFSFAFSTRHTRKSYEPVTASGTDTGTSVVFSFASLGILTQDLGDEMLFGMGVYLEVPTEVSVDGSTVTEGRNRVSLEFTIHLLEGQALATLDGISIASSAIDWVGQTLTLPKSIPVYKMVTRYEQSGGVLNAKASYETVHANMREDGKLQMSRYRRIKKTTVTTNVSNTTPLTTMYVQATNPSSNRLLTNVSFTMASATHRVTMQGKVVSTAADGTLTEIGTANTATGLLTLTSWVTGASSAITNWSALWAPPTPGVNSPFYVGAVTVRTAASPLRPSSLTISGVDWSGTLRTGTSNSAGQISGGITGTVDYDNGILKINGGGYIDASTLKYNAVAYSYLPLDADILGLDPVRLPSDGRVPIFRAGGFAVVGHTGEITATVSNGQTIDCARVRLSRVRVVGNDGAVINSGYSTNLEAGTVTFSDVSGYSQPVTIQHRIEDMAVVRDAQITGAISFTRPLTHAYPLGSYVSSALIAGDLFAQVNTQFDQASWDGTFKDLVSGSAATATRNTAQYPIAVTNRGAITERWAVQFTNTTSFNVVGEHVGVIATGNTSTDCAPVNPATNAPYFTIPAAGWGNGWSTGNLFRFNTVGASFPVWVVRTVQQGPETVTNDNFTLLIRGDVDATA